MDKGVSSAIDKIAEEQTSKVSQKDVNPSDVAEFKDAYNNQVNTKNPADNPFVNFIGDARDKFNKQMHTITTLSSDTSPASLVKVQFAISSMMVTQDITAKAVGKANQTLETLLKMQ
jgi:type III secretion system YscI/HrpB-like protein